MVGDHPLAYRHLPNRVVMQTCDVSEINLIPLSMLTLQCAQCLLCSTLIPQSITYRAVSLYVRMCEHSS